MPTFYSKILTFSAEIKLTFLSLKLIKLEILSLKIDSGKDCEEGSLVRENGAMFRG